MLTVIRQGNFSVDELVGYLKGFLETGVNDPVVRGQALTIVLDNPGVNPLISLHGWVREHVQYRDDPSMLYPGEVGELFISPVYMIKKFQGGEQLFGDCDDSALLLTTLYRCIGYDAHIVLLDTEGTGFNHSISMVNLEGMTVYADATGNTPVGWIQPYRKYLIV